MGGGRRNVRVAATIGTVPKAAVQNMGCVADGGRNGHVYRNPNDIRTPNSVVRIAVQAGNIDHLVCFVGSHTLRLLKNATPHNLLHINALILLLPTSPPRLMTSKSLNYQPF